MIILQLMSRSLIMPAWSYRECRHEHSGRGFKFYGRDGRASNPPALPRMQSADVADGRARHRAKTIRVQSLWSEDAGAKPVKNERDQAFIESIEPREVRLARQAAEAPVAAKEY